MSTNPAALAMIGQNGLVTSGVTNYQSNSGVNPTTMYMPGYGYVTPSTSVANNAITTQLQAQPQGYSASQTGVPGQSQDPYQTGVTINAPDPNNPGSEITSPANPYQWANDVSSQALAQYLGGSVQQQQLSGPGYSYSTPQNQVQVPGSNDMVNAGLALQTLNQYGSGPTDLGSYDVQRDLGTTGGQSAAQWALSNPQFQMNPLLSNSGPGYNMVYNPQTGTYTNQATGQTGLTQSQAVGMMQQANGMQIQGAGSAYIPPSSGGSQIPQNQSVLNTSNLQVHPDTNGSYVGTVTVGGQPQSIAVLPNGQVYNSAGQNVTSQISQSDLSNLYSSFGQASGNSQYTSSLNSAATSAGVPTSSNNNNPGGITTSSAGLRLTGPSYSSTGVTGPSVSGAPSTGGTYNGTAAGNTNLISSQSNGTGAAPNSQYNSTAGNGNPYSYLGGQYNPNTGSYSMPQFALYNPGIGSSAQPGAQPYTGPALDQQAQQNRNIAIGQGSSIDQSLQNYVNYESGQNTQSQQQLSSAYAPIAAGQGGYTAAQQAAITQQPYLNSLQITPDQEQSNYLTPAEQSAITGNTNAPLQQLATDEGSLNQAWQSNSDAVNAQLAAQNAGVTGAVNNATTGVQGAANQEYGNISNVLTQTNPAVQQYIDPTALNTSANYMQNETVSPQDQQNILNEAANTVRGQEQTDEATLLQNAQAQGNTSPLGSPRCRYPKIETDFWYQFR